MRAFVFKNRGLLLSLPAIALVARGKPSCGSVALGLPIAIAGELIRCWAVGYSGETTRNEVVTARKLVTAGPYAYTRNPLYIGNFVTAAGFAIAFTGRNCPFMRSLLVGGSLAAMGAVYAAIVPHEEAFLQSQFPDEFERYCEAVPRVIPRSTPIDDAQGEWSASVVRTAESKTFVTFGAMLLALWLKARKTP
ncbi:MAG: isoprenylcysteine carboxylmethyltransferase family protein [Candidatus Cybelea sp.]